MPRMVAPGFNSRCAFVLVAQVLYLLSWFYMPPFGSHLGSPGSLGLPWVRLELTLPVRTAVRLTGFAGFDRLLRRRPLASHQKEGWAKGSAD